MSRQAKTDGIHVEWRDLLSFLELKILLSFEMPLKVSAQISLLNFIKQI